MTFFGKISEYSVREKSLFVNLYSGLRLNFKDKSPVAAMTWEKIHDNQVTVLQEVKLHLQGRRTTWWRIKREGRNVSKEKGVVFYKHSRCHNRT